MAAVNPPGFLQARADHSALTMRRNTMMLMDGAEWRGTIPRGGIHPAYGGTMDVTASVSTMQVTVASGMVAIPHSQAFGGLYTAYNDGDVTLNVDAADPTQYRRDLVIAEILDTTDADVDDFWQLRVVKGTNSASPPAPLPTVPDKSETLNTINVDPGITNLDGKLTGGQRYIPTIGGTLLSASDSDRVNPARAGMLNTQADQNIRLTYWDGAKWSFVADNGWSTYTPAVSGWGSATFSSRTGRWKWIGEKIIAVIIQLTTSSAGSGFVATTVGLPVTPSRIIRQQLMLTTEVFGGAEPTLGAALILTGTSGAWIDRLRIPDSGGNIFTQTGIEVPDNYLYWIQGFVEVA